MVRVEPSGAAFDVAGGETIIQAAWRNGYTWPTICNGQGTCKTCVFLILEGGDNLSEIESWEARGLAEIAGSVPQAGATARLACQAKVTGDVRVRKIGVRLADSQTIGR